MLDALRLLHPVGSWAFFEELRAGTGYRSTAKGINPEQRFDAWAMSLWPSKNFERVAYEVKVSRADFLRELAAPKKRQQALQLSNYFYFAAPRGLIKPEELPPETGLVEVWPGESVAHVMVKAPYREGPEFPTWQFMASIARRIQITEMGR